MKNVGIYYRVSTEKQDLASQQLAIQEFLNGLPTDKKPKNVLVFQDEAISGKTTKRPGYQALMAAVASGKIDTILVYKLDRFSRDASTAIRTILGLDQQGVGFISVTQNALNLGHDNPFRRTFLALFADLAQVERETTVARVKAGLAAARARGVKLGNPKATSEETKKKARDLKKQGASYRAIAAQLNLSLGAVQRAVKGAA